MSQQDRKTWISILIASVVIVGILAVSAVGGTAYFIYRHVHTQFTPSENAEQQFAEARARFAGQQPLIEMRKGDEPRLHREVIPKKMPATKLDTLRVLAYDTRARKLVNVSIPMWLLRMAPSNKFSFMKDNGIDFDSDRVHITIDDLERRGPGLILDQTERRGSQVLVWTE
jgi:type II secretory pathway pseudopilin PulG